MTTHALHVPTNQVVEVLQDGNDVAYVRFDSGKSIQVRTRDLEFDFDDDSDWGADDRDLGMEDLHNPDHAEQHP